MTAGKLVVKCARCVLCQTDKESVILDPVPHHHWKIITYCLNVGAAPEAQQFWALFWVRLTLSVERMWNVWWCFDGEGHHQSLFSTSSRLFTFDESVAAEKAYRTLSSLLDTVAASWYATPVSTVALEQVYINFFVRIVKMSSWYLHQSCEVLIYLNNLTMSGINCERLVILVCSWQPTDVSCVQEQKDTQNQSQFLFCFVFCFVFPLHCEDFLYPPPPFTTSSNHRLWISRKTELEVFYLRPQWALTSVREVKLDASSLLFPDLKIESTDVTTLTNTDQSPKLKEKNQRSEVPPKIFRLSFLHTH